MCDRARSRAIIFIGSGTMCMFFRNSEPITTKPSISSSLYPCLTKDIYYTFKIWIITFSQNVYCIWTDSLLRWEFCRRCDSFFAKRKSVVKYGNTNFSAEIIRNDSLLMVTEREMQEVPLQITVAVNAFFLL